MRKAVTIVFCLLFLSLPLYASHVNIIGVGDSIAHGYWYSGGTDGVTNNLWDQLIISLGHPTWTYNNYGSDATPASYVDSNINTWLASDTPTYVYCHTGTNDLGFYGTSLSSYLATMSSILSKCVSGSASLIVDQILPRQDYISTVKLWNAALEDWCRTNSIKMAPVYQELCSTSASTDDYLNYPTYTGDTVSHVHPNPTGYTYMGLLAASADIPARKRVWGAASYPLFSYVSWKWWILSGTANITLDSDKGDLNLAQNDSAVSTVECLVSGSKTINITASTRSGACNIYYRTAASTNFNRDAATSWTTYASAFSTTDQFIQVKVSNTSATPAVIRYVAMTWSGSADGAEVDIDPPIPITASGTYTIH